MTSKSSLYVSAYLVTGLVIFALSLLQNRRAGGSLRGPEFAVFMAAFLTMWPGMLIVFMVGLVTEHKYREGVR